MIGAISEPGRLEALGSWAVTLAESLDAWYDGITAENALALREWLFAAQECCSAFTLLDKEFEKECERLEKEFDKEYVKEFRRCGRPPPLNPPDCSLGTRRFCGDWGAKVRSRLQELQMAIDSLELEGFNVSTPPERRPKGIPRAHRWWWFAPPWNSHVC